jgi:hypothetical protein
MAYYKVTGDKELIVFATSWKEAFNKYREITGDHLMNELEAEKIELKDTEPTIKVSDLKTMLNNFKSEFIRHEAITGQNVAVETSIIDVILLNFCESKLSSIEQRGKEGEK